MGLSIGSNSNVTKVVLKNTDGTVSGTIVMSKPKKGKKKLQYNFKQISVQLMRSKTSGNASKIASKARGKIAQLRKMLKTGNYDDKELEAAILHAEQIERVARKRVKHLQEEESAKTHGGICEADIEEYIEFDWEDFESKNNTEPYMEELKALMQEFQELMLDTMQQMNEASGLAELSEELMVSVRTEMDPKDLELLKKKHRSDELREIMEADMKYLKAIFNKLEKEKKDASSGGSSGGISLELGGVEMPVANVEVPVITEGGSVDVTV